MKILIPFWLRRNLKQGRILIIYSLGFVLLLLNAFIYSGRYAADLDTQSTQIRGLKERIERITTPDTLAGSSVPIIMPPSRYRFLVDNNLEDVPTERWVSPHNAFLPTNANNQRQQVIGLWDIDLSFLVGIIFTFLAVVLTFDSISGEREQGTLKLLMTTGVSRASIVISKIVSSIIALAMPLLLGLIVNYLYLNFAGVMVLSADNLFLYGLFFFFALLLLSFFVSLGVLISSLTRNSITSLVVLLLIWVSMVIVVPGIAKPITKETVGAMTPEEYSNAQNAVGDEMFEDYKRTGAMDRPPEMARADNWSGEIKWNTIRAKFLNSRQTIIDDHLRDLYLQARSAQNISRMTPTMVFNLAVSRAVGNDFGTVSEFHEQVKRYRTVLKEFMAAQDALDNESPHLLNSDGRGYLSTKPFNAELPLFEYQRTSLAARIGDTLFDVLILFSLSMVAMVVAVFAFNRYDVR